jgi:hypothetical protein
MIKDTVIQVKGMYGWALKEICNNNAEERLAELQKANPNKEYRIKTVENGWWNDQVLVR